MLHKFFKKELKKIMKARHMELSIISSADDELSHPNEYLISLSLEAIKNAQQVNLEEVSKRIKKPPFYPDIWPGEHYKLLAGLVLALNPKIVLEIGTGQGLSALSMKKYLSNGSKLVTFDVIAWNKFLDTYLESSDFDESFIQYTDDLNDYSNMLKHENLLKSADIIFVDAAKDGIMEYKFLKGFRKIKLKTNAIIILDDIRVWNMLAFWRNIDYPKIDLTSFGHWSGTGIFQWVDK